MKKRWLITLISVLLGIIMVLGLSACGKVEFKVNFVVDGEIYATVDTNGKEVIKMPTNPTKEDYTFDGWYWDEGEWQRPFTANSLLDAPLSSDMSVYAKFVSDEIPPTEAFVVNGLKGIPNITGVEAVTEHNDPNGQLGKAGGYIACVYFSVDVIEQAHISGTTLVDKGTAAGGCVEVYATSKDAEKRNEYLSAFDGGIMSSGSHAVVGTCVIRTANSLTASQQNILEGNITKMLTGSNENYVSLDTYLIQVAKQLAEEKLLSEYEAGTELISLGYPVAKAEQIAKDCGVNWNNIAKLKAEGFAEYYATVSPVMICELLADHEFTESQIEYAIENASINWKFYAVAHAKEFVSANESRYYISPLDVVVYLNNDKGYSVDDAEYAVANCDVNWNTKALEYISAIEEDGALGPKGDYITALLDVNFTQAQAEYAVNNCGNNWNNHALLCVKHYVEDLCSTPPNHSECIAKLKDWGFSDSEANYAVNNYSGLIYPDKVDYVITLNPNGGSVSMTTINVEFGKSYTLPTPTKSGYTFKGWYNGSTQVTSGTWYATSDLNLIAQWGETEYSITYDLAGGTNNASNPGKYTTTESVTLLAPTKHGHTFIGWKASGETTAVYSPTIAKGSTGNKTYTAVWQANTYTITFNANGGTCAKVTETVTYGQRYTPPTPTKTGYAFNNWHYDTGMGYNEEYCNDTFNIDHDVTFIAYWNPNYYTITYDVNGGTLSSTTQSVAYDSTYTLHTPTRTGYTFLGWYNNGEKASGGKWTSTTNLTLKAEWSVKSYKLTFDANGGQCDTTSLTVEYDERVTLPTPVRTGYLFNGWYSGNKLYYSGTWATDSNVSLTASWVARTDVEYTVNFYLENAEDNGYTLHETRIYTGTADSTVSAPQNFYTGFTAPAYQKVKINPEGSTVVNYYYTRNTYTITFFENGGEDVSSITAKYDAPITLPTPTKDGMTFGGWYLSSWFYDKAEFTSMPSSGYQLFARWNEETDPKLFKYDYSYDGITVTGYTGTSTTMWIPTHIYGKPVIAISASAFANNTTITKAVVPNTVQTIGSAAFKGCSSLADITLPFVGMSESATENYQKVFGYIFGHTNYGSNVGTSNTSYEYTGQGVAYNSAYQYACYIPTSVKHVTISKQTEIPANAFYNCDLLESIVIPESTTNVGEYAFYGCAKVSSYNANNDGVSVLPNTLVDIANYAFYGNSSLEKLVISSDVENIGSYAFYNCTNLKELVADSTITKLKTIGNSAFYGCVAMSKSFNGANKEINIPNGVEIIGSYAFYNNDAITKVVVADTVTTINEAAFKSCSALTDMILPFVGKSETVSNDYQQVFGYIFGYTNYGSNVVTSNTSYDYTGQGIAYSSSYHYGYYIPDSIKNVTITKQTSIPANAFYNCDLLETIVIPQNTTTIGDYAFYGCAKVSSYNANQDGTSILPTTLTSISNYAFYGNTALNKVVISSDVESIGACAFYNCTNLTECAAQSTITKLKTIGNSAFYNCTTLSKSFNGISGEINVPSGVETIGSYAFYNNDAISKIIVANTVVTISDAAFKGCSSLTDVSLPFVGMSENATHDYQKVFGYIFGYVNYGSNVLTSNTTSDYTGQGITYSSSYHYGYYIPDTIRNVTITKQTSIPANAFYNCDLLETIVIPQNATAFGNNAFYNCKALKSFVIPNSIASISQYAFYNCSSMTSCTMENSAKLISIGECAFSGCTNLVKVFGGDSQELIIPNGVTTIGAYAFSNIANFKNLIVPDSMLTIGNGAFKGFNSLESITIPFVGGSIETVDNYDNVLGFIFGTGYIYAYSAPDTNKMSKEGLTYQGYRYNNNDYYGYYIPTTLTVVTITKQTEIPANAFRNCDLIETINIPEDTTAIKAYSFYNCTKLTTINIPKEAAIGDDAFVNSGLLNKTGIIYIGSVLYKYNGTMPSGYTLRVKDGTTAIQANAFSGCSGLTTLILPEGLKSIGANAFKNCTGLTEVVVPSSVEFIGASAFYGCSALKTITIPFVGTSATSDSAFSSIFSTVPTTLTTVVVTGNVDIPDNAFKNCNKLTTISFTGSVGKIGANAFYGCSALTTLTLPNTVTEIGNYAFYSCSKLSSVSLSEMENLTSIGSYAFQNCAALTSIVVPESVSSINDYTFSGCAKLTTVSLSSQTTAIGNYAFNGCTSLTTLTLNSNVIERIGAYAFQNCSNLANIYVPASVATIGEYAFNGCSVLVINCGATSQPDDWDYNWNPSNCTVAWGK